MDSERVEGFFFFFRTYFSIVWCAFQPTKIMAKYMAPMANTRWKKPNP